MAREVNPPRGMRDFLPLDKAKRERVLAAIRSSYLAHGFQEVETPALEELSRLTSGQGGDNEMLAFRVQKRGEEAGRALEKLQAEPGTGLDALSDLGLRYDLTVPLTRFYASHHDSLPRVFKAIQIGPVWRAERPQKGRYRQFVQCDIDIIGEAGPSAEVELLVASLATLDRLGVSEARVRVNHRALLAKSLDTIGVPASARPKAMIIIDKLDKIGADAVAVELAEAISQEVGAAARLWLSSLEAEPKPPEELAGIFELVAVRFPGKLRFDPTLVRGMGYYTGSIFEIEHPASGGSIGGGGRYDGMVGRWLERDAPAVGISLGFERLVDLLPEDLDQDGVKSLVLVLEDSGTACLANALRLQAEAIARGYRVRLEHRPKRLSLLLENMKSQGFASFALVSADSAALSSLEIKELD